MFEILTGANMVIFGEVDGKKVYKYTISNGTIAADIINFGARVTSLRVLNKHDKFLDVVLGHNTLDEYVNNFGYLGATIGRVAGRIGGGKFVLDGKAYTATINQKGNSLHGGKSGFDKKVWDIDFELSNDKKIVMRYVSSDGEEGFPGTLISTVTYSITDENGLKIEYYAKSDATTIVGFMNHSYFNLSGECGGAVYETQIQILSDTITPLDKNNVVSGDLQKICNTEYDFCKFKQIGAFDKMCFSYGANCYDINYYFPNSDLKLMASAKNFNSGIKMDVYSDANGLQFYTPTFLGGVKGKNGIFSGNDSFCLETQRIPNAINCKNFPSPILRKGENYYSVTEYRFSLVK